MALGLGLSYEKKPAPMGAVATIKNQDGTVVARILLDTHGAVCSCDWPVCEGKCVHLLLLQRQEGKALISERPTGLGGKMWAWQAA